MPPDQLRLQMATRDFQSTRLFGTAEPLLEAIESRGRKSSADQTLFFVTVVCNQLDEIHLQMLRLKVVPWGWSRLLISASTTNEFMILCSR